MRDFIVGGVPLRDPQGQWTIDYTRSSLGNAPAREIPGEQPFGFHGDPVAREGFFGVSRDTIVLNLIGSTKDDFAALYGGFEALFGRPENLAVSAPQRSALAGGSARAGQTFSNNQDELRQAPIRMVGNIAKERIDEAAARLTIIVENRLAFWQSVNYYTTDPLVLASGSGTLDLKTILADSQGVANDGLLRIKGPFAAAGVILIRDRATNSGIRYNSTTALTGSQYVVIDLQTLHAELQSTDTWAITGGTDVSNRLDVFGPGMFGFSPGAVVSFPASNDYFAGITASGQTNGSTAIEARLRRSYL